MMQDKRHCSALLVGESSLEGLVAASEVEPAEAALTSPEEQFSKQNLPW
jgi:hypothetical protein